MSPNSALECPICADEMAVSSSDAAHCAVGLTCCGQRICQSCLYRHILSIFEEGRTGQGRTSLQCPVGCGSELTDKLVRDTIDRAHAMQWFWRLVGTILCRLVRFLTNNTNNNHTDAEAAWYTWSHCQPVKEDLNRYEQWSLVVGLRKQSTVHCPAPGCDYQWISNDLYRRHKQAHEAKNFVLWYKPPKPDKSGSFNWAEPEFVNLGNTGKYVEPDLSDGRRMVCAKCLSCFCGLCRQPWEFGTGRRRRCHQGIPCERYRRSMPFDSDYAFVAQLARTRSCPGCSVRTQRTEGCNHMVCPCGFEWCYVCECHWHVFHYRCVDRVDDRPSGMCVVS